MNTGTLRLVFGVTIAAIFFGCILLAIEGGKNFLHISVGFFTVAIVGGVVITLRAPFLIAIAAFFFMVMMYIAHKAQWDASLYGAAAGLLVVALIQIGWIGADQRTQFNRESYAQEQARLHEQEKQGRSAGGPGAQGQG